MIFHQFKYTILCFVRQKMSLFWILAFPILLVTFYKIGFAGIPDSETIPEVNMGIVKGQYVNDSFEEVAKSSGMFTISVLDETEAKKRLAEGALDLYVIDLDNAAFDAKGNTNENATTDTTENIGENAATDTKRNAKENATTDTTGNIGENATTDTKGTANENATTDPKGNTHENAAVTSDVTAGNIRMVTGGNGVGQSIAKLFVDAYTQITLVTEEIGEEALAKTMSTGNKVLMEQVFAKFKDWNVTESNVKHEPLGGSTNPLVIFYYGAIAMSALTSSFSGAGAVMNCQANQSVTAGRVNLSPIRKMMVFFSTCAANYLLQFTAITLMLLYIKYVIGMDIGANFAMIMLVAAIGVFTGICMGAMVGVLIKKGIKVKEAILQVVCVFGGFLAGMMDVNTKYLVHERLPLVEKINPASLISDSLYVLYFYNTYDRVFVNLGILLLEAALFAAVAIWVLRRKKYASI